MDERKEISAIEDIILQVDSFYRAVSKKSRGDKMAGMFLSKIEHVRSRPLNIL